MSQEERQRYHVLETVINGRITLKKGCHIMGVGYQQAKRLKKPFEDEEDL